MNSASSVLPRRVQASTGGKGSSFDLRVTFGYDVQGNRIWKNVDADGNGPGSAVTTKFAYDEDVPGADGAGAGVIDPGVAAGHA